MWNIKQFTFNPFSENTYLLYTPSKNAFLVDPGCYTPSEQQELMEFIAQEDLKITSILLTHAHIDHVLGLQWAADTFAVGVRIHPLEMEILERNPMTAAQYGFFFKPFVGELLPIEAGEDLQLDGLSLKVLFVPGHSPGHVAYYSSESAVMVSGDVLFQGSIGRTDLYKGNHAQLLESVRTEIFTLPGATQVFSGHGPSTTVGFEKEHNPFF